MLDAMQTDSGPVVGNKKRMPNDCAEETKEVVMEATSLAKEKKVSQAVEKLLSMEKKARLANDTQSVQSCCLTILIIYLKEKDFDNLNKYIPFLCKRRAQAESVQTSIITTGVNRLVKEVQKLKIPNARQETERLIVTLREVSAGKLMVEVPRAQLTMMLAKMKEEDKKYEEAAKLIQEETPETYTSMERRAKFDYIIEQVRLCFLAKDFLRTKILLKKIDLSALEQFQDLKEKYLKLEIDFAIYEKDTLRVAKAYLNLLTCVAVKEDAKRYDGELNNALLFLACSKYSNEQVDLIHNVLLKETNINATFKEFITRFVTDEVVQWPLPEHNLLVTHPHLAKGEEKMKQLTKGKGKYFSFISQLEGTDEWLLKNLFDRVIEHDIRVVAKYYSKLFMDSLAVMLNLDVATTEVYISEMVAEGALETKIDRPEGIVIFQLDQSPQDTLSEWTSGITDLISLVDKTCHLIHKENMVHEATN